MGEEKRNIPLKLLALPAPMTIGIPHILEIKYLERNKVFHMLAVRQLVNIVYYSK